jgi:hypothetical protein
MIRPLLVLTALLLPLSAAATQYVPVDFREMVTASEAIVHGHVVDVRSEPTRDRLMVVTYVTLDVAEHLKGTFRDSVTFRVPGGQVGRYRRIIVGAPQFERGDEVVLFLSARGPSVPYVFGLSQGVFRIARAADGRALVTPPAVMARGAGAERVVRGDPARRPLPLATFTRDVRTILEGR